MILADTSVWIDYFNGNENKYTDALDTHLDSETVVMGDLILLEILQGFKRVSRHRRQLNRRLLEVNCYPKMLSMIVYSCRMVTTLLLILVAAH